MFLTQGVSDISSHRQSGPTVPRAGFARGDHGTRRARRPDWRGSQQVLLGAQGRPPTMAAPDARAWPQCLDRHRRYRRRSPTPGGAKVY